MNSLELINEAMGWDDSDPPAFSTQFTKGHPILENLAERIDKKHKEEIKTLTDEIKTLTDKLESVTLPSYWCKQRGVMEGARVLLELRESERVVAELRRVISLWNDAVRTLRQNQQIISDIINDIDSD